MGHCLRLQGQMQGAGTRCTRRRPAALGVIFSASIIDHARGSSCHLFPAQQLGSAAASAPVLDALGWAGTGGLEGRHAELPPTSLSHAASLSISSGATCDCRKSGLWEVPCRRTELPGLEMMHRIQEEGKLIDADKIRIVLFWAGDWGVGEGECWPEKGQTWGNFLGRWTCLALSLMVS